MKVACDELLKALEAGEGDTAAQSTVNHDGTCRSEAKTNVFAEEEISDQVPSQDVSPSQNVQGGFNEKMFLDVIPKYC